MADPDSVSLSKHHFFQPLLPGFHNFLNIPVKFFQKHIEGRTGNMTAKLRSDVSYKTWEVKMDGRRFTGGWKDFAVDHDFRIGDFIVFRYEGNLVFHVTGFGPSCCNLQYSSSSHDNETNSHEHTGNDSRKEKKARKNLKTGSKYTCLEVTASNLRLDRRGFARSNGLENRWCEIDLMNEHGSSWTLYLRRRATDGQVYIVRGWTSFCQANGFKAGSFCKFKMVRNGTRPVIQLCPKEPSHNTDNTEEGSEAIERKSCSSKPKSARGSSKRKEGRAPASSGQHRFLKLNLTPSILRTGQLRLPTRFMSSNGIKKSVNITLMDKYGVEWLSYLHLVKGQQLFYISCRDFIKANGVKKGETFTLELIWGDKTPIFRFCPEIQQEEKGTETMADVNALKRRTHETVQTRTAAEKPLSEAEVKAHKRVRVRDPEDRPNHQDDWDTDSTTRMTSGTASESSRRTRSNPITKAKQNITDTLTAVRQFREVLDTKERNLDAVLRELDAFGM
ncbi:PREDICTED: B3 domain-containing protein REM3-like isoform X2 [Tarenaya hassleriana]|uniref:B3 domain-containing protein REM3-like isoform X2 n=1 Tax=Tarenaya hassleriana TaxID=28532 RepID=UPI00053C6ED5|nr:PREDICTED: B3 domain-containing protein REM3-like isoform X2 [Tarenaya hassleriana]